MERREISRSEVERVKPYNAEGGKAAQVERMFDTIAPAYDFMNRAMTLGIDRLWRRRACRAVASAVGSASPRLLDVATGTGDFALALYSHCPCATVTGIDLSEGMLDVAREKIRRKGLADAITFARADALQLPFGDAAFDAVTVAFGVRNFEHLDRGYAELHRVLRSGGVLCVLELSTPQNRLVRWFYDLYTLHVIPFIGGLRSGDREAYRYLPRSIAAVPQGDSMLALMRQAGFTRTGATTLTLGTATIYLGFRE